MVRVPHRPLLPSLPTCFAREVGTCLEDFEGVLERVRDRDPVDFAQVIPHLPADRYSSQFKNNYFAEMCSGSEEGSYLRLIDFCITQL